MSEFDQVFSEIFSQISALNRRLKNFETWEPGRFVSAHAYRASNLAVAGGAGYQSIAFDAELWDTHSINASGVFTIPSDGYYLLIANVTWNSFVGSSYARIYKDATTFFGGEFDGALESARVVGIMDLSANDTVEFQLSPTVGLTMVGAVGYYYASFFQVVKIY